MTARRIVEVFKVAGYWRVRINGKLHGSYHTKSEAMRAAKVAK